MAESYDHPRQFPRIAKQTTLLVKKLGPHEIEEFASTTNLGLGGCRFISDEPLGEGANLELLMSVQHKVVKARARVVHEHAIEGGRFEIGAEFLALDEADRQIIEKLFERKPE